MAAPAWQARASQSLGIQTTLADMQHGSSAGQTPVHGHLRPQFGASSVTFTETPATSYRDFSDMSTNPPLPNQQSLVPGASLSPGSASHASQGSGQPALPPGPPIVAPGQPQRASGQPSMPPGQTTTGSGQPASLQGFSVATVQPGIYGRPGQAGSYLPPTGAFLGNRWSTLQAIQPGTPSAAAVGARTSAETVIAGSGSALPPSAPLSVGMTQSSGAACGPSPPQSSFPNYPPGGPLGPPQMPPWILNQQPAGQPQPYPPFGPYSGYQIPFSRPSRQPGPYQESPSSLLPSQIKQSHVGMPLSSPNAWGSQPAPSTTTSTSVQHGRKDVTTVSSVTASAPGLASQLPSSSAAPSPDEHSDIINDLSADVENGLCTEQGSPAEKDRLVEAQSLEEEWSAHRTADGRVYYYNSVSGDSTYEKPAGFTGEVDKVTAQPTPVSWERIAGTDWALVNTNDSKKYYFNTRSQITSWQIPQEVAQLRKDQAEEVSSRRATEAGVALAAASEKNNVSFSLNVPAAASGGREAVGHKGVVTAMGSSALDLIKKKLQDVGSPVAMNPIAGTNGTSAAEVHSGKGLAVESGKEKSASSDSSSESDDEDPGPTKEERIVQFKDMLKEKGVAPFSKWEKELPKIIFDVRFKAIPSYTERRSIFEHYVRTRADEERKEKRAAQKAAIKGFKLLLDEAAKEMNHATDFESFAKVWSGDPRFQALDRKDREALLQERVLPLRKAEEERVKSELAAAVNGFKAMLLEKGGDINTGTRWSKVKDSLRHDTRCRAVKREDREALFNAYVGELRAAEQESERAAKLKRDEEEKLKERDRELRKRKEREEQEVERVRSKARRKEAISGFQTLLTEKIKDPEASWTEARLKLGKDPQGRASNPELDFGERERLFRAHVNDLYVRAVREYRLLLADVITVDAATKQLDAGRNILTSWTDAKKLLKADARYSKTPRRERESWWRKYADDVQRRVRAADQENLATNGSKSAAVEPGKRSPGVRRNPRG